MRSVQQEWESYRNAVIPPDAPQIQHQECKRAFYAGAHSIMQFLMSMSDDNLSEEAGSAILEGLRQELCDFASRVGISE